MDDPTTLSPSVVEQDLPQVRTSKVKSEKTASQLIHRNDPEISRLKEENKALQLRVLGVNELARLLQDRNEVVQVLEEKNKRLEVAVVRLENRCSNFERKLKMQGGAGFVPKPGQSPFIPGPSRQILEALMKENSELKKTLNKVTNKGASGYLEAVKIIQLEEVIEQEKQEIDFLKNQIKSLTSGFGESAISSDENSLSVSSSADVGALKRQLIKMQHSMKVKDRFCTLLSQQVSDLQEKLSNQQQDAADGSDTSTKSTSTSSPVQEITEHDPRSLSKEILKNRPKYSQDVRDTDEELVKQRDELETKYERLMEEQKETLQSERKERMSLVDRLQEIEGELKTKQTELDALERRCEDLTSYNNTLVDEKTELTQLLSTKKEQEKEAGPQTKEMEGQLKSLNQQVEDQVTSYSEDLQKKNDEISRLRMLLEDSHMNLAIAESKLGSIKNEKDQELISLKDKIEDLQTDLAVMQGEKEELAREKREFQIALGQARAGQGPRPMMSSSYTGALLPREYSARMSSHGPSLILPSTTQGMIMVADGTKQKATTSPQYSQSSFYDSMRPMTGPHCGPSAVDNPIRPLVPLVPRGDPVPPTTTSMEKPHSLRLNMPSHFTHPYPTTNLSPSVTGLRQNLPMQTPTTPVASFQTTQAPVSPRSHSPNAYPRTTMFPQGQRPAGYSRQYTAPVTDYHGYGRYQSNIQQQGPTYSTSSHQGYMPRFHPVGSSAPPGLTYTSQESTESGYKSYGSGMYPSGGSGMYPSGGSGMYPSGGSGMYPSGGSGMYPSGGSGTYPSGGSLGPRHYERRSSSPQQPDHPHQQ